MSLVRLYTSTKAIRPVSLFFHFLGVELILALSAEEDLVEYVQQLLNQRSNKPTPARTTLKAAVRTVLQWHTTKAKPGLEAKANLLGSDEALAMVMGKIGGLLPS
jgi:hypothetical protein